MTRARFALAFIVTIILAACGGGDGPTESHPGPNGITFLRGANATDTVDARLLQALRIEVRDADGHIAPHTIVRLQAAFSPPDDPMQYGDAEVLVSRLTDSEYYPVLIDSTDERGIVDVLVRLGGKAGTAHLVVSAPVLGVQNTATYTVLPGAAASVRSFPADTSVKIGSALTLRGGVYDRNGNVRGESFTYAMTGTSGAATLNGMVVTGVAFGRVQLVASAGALRDTSWVNVVPPGTVAAFSSPDNTGQAAAIYTFDLDGSGFREVRSSIVGTGYFGDMPVGWLSPTKLVYHDNNWNHTKQLYVVDLTTNIASRFLPLSDQMSMENFPRLNRDRSWVYFSGGTFESYQLYRARADGTGKERLSPEGITVKEWAAAPSPDGTQVAFVRNGDYYAGALQVLDLATRQVRSLNRAGRFPKWSPDGSQIAYIAETDAWAFSAGPLSVTTPDGSTARALTNGTVQFNGDIDWSSDGKYIVGVATTGTLAVVEVATGEVLVLTLPNIGRHLSSPVWKP